MKKAQRFFSRLLCYGFSLIMIVSIIGTFFFGLSSVTIGNRNYLFKAFMNSETINALYIDLTENMKSVSEETDIPDEVFSKAVNTDFIKSVQTTVINSIYSGQNESFDISSDLRTRYTKSIEKYYKSSKIKYTDKDLKNAADLAVKAFDESCGIKNNSELAPFANFIRNYSVKLVLLFFAGIVVCIFMIYILTGRRHKGFNYVGMSLITAGEIMIAIPLITKLCNILSDLNYTNIAAYNSLINQTVNNILVISAVSGTVFIGVGVSIFAVNYKYYSHRLLNNETEYEIYKNLT